MYIIIPDMVSILVKPYNYAQPALRIQLIKHSACVCRMFYYFLAAILDRPWEVIGADTTLSIPMCPHILRYSVYLYLLFCYRRL
jgi:hypothetical protein